MEAADSGAGDQPEEHLFHGVTRPHGALAVITVVEKFSLRRPGEDHRLAAESDAIGEARSVERRHLERVVKAMDVKQHIAHSGCRRKQIAYVGYCFDRSKTPIIQTDRSKREPAILWRRELCTRKTHFRSTVRPEPRLGPRAVQRLTGGCDEQRWLGRKLRCVKGSTRSRHRRASFKREHRRGRCEHA